MATIRAIKGRIKSAKNISQITKAMQMVSAAKMRKAQEVARQGKPYREKIQEAVGELASRIDPTLHPLLRMGNPDGKTMVVLISTNKGLCGGLNTSLFRNVLKWLSHADSAEFITLGKKGQRFVIRSGWDLSADFSEGQIIQSVAPVTQLFVEGFLNGAYKEVYIIYNRFVSSLKQEPIMVPVLPLAVPELGSQESEKQHIEWSEFIIEPSAREVLNQLLPHYVETLIRSAILEAEASEHSARMVAMKNATDNAKSLIGDLTLAYNRLRQENITTEIADIVTARESMR
ncbi:ATP synthase F1 subunit gamma [Candidatus Roizmanbacteria bacterium RIFCSPLOWO2_01_FULL_40_14]|uniref:ATP synthase gamma chain n=1 Tax=Candidatus Roizmanbacteria bacterium GW2011_GWB1_40_7 TaxID=1618482 RepID=A0A0G0TA51_9BACT|nr:MAG: ATP synthase gamma chain [Candidatus Roizmanbacteria bacterium GW2011_GWB1_40_7]OGK48461.1 MAG: ATP synthase F1 subunit gamma [Candidatus Roizmanbacteria bacterium RIFCSPLOWO2_01_FULL_40_14]